MGRESPWLTAIVSATLPEWPMLSTNEQLCLEEIAEDLVNRVTWEASRGFALDSHIRGVIAGHAALLAVGLPRRVFNNVTAIVVHPATITMQGPRTGLIPGTVDDSALPVFGHTTARGPVFIAWDAALQQASHPDQGHNVVFHEFAHKLDAEDGMLDGTPRLPDRAQRQRWVEVCETEYRSLRRGHGSVLLSEYAATNPSEFFAVATEVFFRRGPELAADRSDLYDVLRSFYRQDPASRWRPGAS